MERYEKLGGGTMRQEDAGGCRRGLREEVGGGRGRVERLGRVGKSGMEEAAGGGSDRKPYEEVRGGKGRRRGNMRGRRRKKREGRWSLPVVVYSSGLRHSPDTDWVAGVVGAPDGPLGSLCAAWSLLKEPRGTVVAVVAPLGGRARNEEEEEDEEKEDQEGNV
eukprot:4684904-Pyramimonas_sp.AAC.1